MSWPPEKCEWSETDFIYIEAVRSCHYHAPPPVPPETKSSGSRGEGEDLCTSANLLHIFCDVFPLENWKFIFPSCDLIYPLAIVPASHIFLNNQVFNNPFTICLSPLLLPLLSCGPHTCGQKRNHGLYLLFCPPTYDWQLMQDLGGKHVPGSSYLSTHNTYSLSVSRALKISLKLDLACRIAVTTVQWIFSAGHKPLRRVNVHNYTD